MARAVVRQRSAKEATMPKLTEGSAERLIVPPGRRDVLIFDGGHEDAVRGFGIRKFASGEAYYFVKYNIGRKQRRQSLGCVTRGNLKYMLEACNTSGDVGAPQILRHDDRGALVRFNARWA